jgi:hypothetical protein
VSETVSIRSALEQLIEANAAKDAEIERLRLGSVDRARMPIETRRLIDIANEQRTRAEKAEGIIAVREAEVVAANKARIAAEARVAKLTEALRTFYSEAYINEIAAAALEEK